MNDISIVLNPCGSRNMYFSYISFFFYINFQHKNKTIVQFIFNQKNLMIEIHLISNHIFFYIL